MGYLMDRHNMTLLGKVPEGKCQMCATEHDPEMPHNLNSLAYQYKFYDEHGRWPGWTDAMAHCDDEVKRLWQAALVEQGIEVR